MRLKDLILKARGFNKAAAKNRIEISRRLKTNSDDKSKLSQVIVVDLSKDFEMLENEENIMLTPFDHISVRTDPNFNEKEFVYVDGQANFPGLYAIQSKSERISDILERAGGLNEFAYANGATLVRKTEYYKKETKTDKQLTSLLALRDDLIKQMGSLSEADIDLLKRINSNLDKLNELTLKEKKAINKTTDITVTKKNDSIQSYLLPNEELFKTTELIAIDLTEVLKKKSSASNLLVQPGDTIVIPKKLETVRLRGHLLNPTSLRYKKNKSTKYYISKAGGFKARADKSKTYVIYPNGEARATKKFLLFNIYPEIVPGSEVRVPEKLQRKPSTDVGTLTGVFTGVATLVLAITQLNL
jgi:protein involved in polysaccharide export with SLBB domain